MTMTKAQSAEAHHHAMNIVDLLRNNALQYRDELQDKLSLTKKQTTVALNILRKLNLVTSRNKCGAILIEYKGLKNGESKTHVLSDGR